MNRLILKRESGQIIRIDTADGPILIRNSAPTKLTIEAPPTVHILRAEAKRTAPPPAASHELTAEERAAYLARIEQLRRRLAMHIPG